MSSHLTDYISALSGPKRGLPSDPDQTDRHTSWEISFRLPMESTDQAIEHERWGDGLIHDRSTLMDLLEEARLCPCRLF